MVLISEHAAKRYFRSEIAVEQALLLENGQRPDEHALRTARANPISTLMRKYSALNKKMA